MGNSKTAIFFLILILILSVNAEANFSCFVNDGSFKTIKFLPSQSNPNLQQATFIDEKTNTKVQFSVDTSNWETSFKFDEFDAKNGSKIFDSTYLSPISRAKTNMTSVSAVGNEYFCGPKVDLDDYNRSNFATMRPSSFQTIEAIRQRHFIASRIVDFFENSKFSINASSVVVITHPEQTFDQGLTKEAYKKFFNDIRESKAPRIGLFAEGIFNQDHASIDKDELDFIGASGGRHQISFSKIKTIVMAGGYLDQCLCSSFASFLKQVNNNEEVTVIFPKEVVTLANYEPVHQTFLPGLSPSVAKQRLKRATSLSQLESEIQNYREFEVRLASFMGKFLFGKNVPDALDKRFRKKEKDLICPFQSTDKVNFNEFEFEILNQDLTSGKTNSIAKIGNGKKRIKIVFAPSERIRDYLSEPNTAVQASIREKPYTLESRRRFNKDNGSGKKSPTYRGTH